MYRRSVLSLLACVSALMGAGQPARAGLVDKVVYVHDQNASFDRVWAFQIKRSGGKFDLSRVPGSPFLARAPGVLGCFNVDCLTLAHSEVDGFLFAAGSAGITVWRVNDDLTLSEVVGSPFGGSQIGGVCIVRVGNQTFVYGASAYPNKGIRAFALQPGGALQELAGSPFDALGGYYGRLVPIGQSILTIKPGEFVINNGELITHGVQADGTLVIRSRQPYDVDGFYPHVGRGGTTAHIAQVNQRILLGYTYDANTGALTASPGSPFAVDPDLARGLLSVAVHDDLAYLYDARTPGGGTPIRGFRINADGTLTPLTPMKDIGEVVTAATFNRSGRCLVTASTNRVRTFSVDPATGQLLPDDRKKIVGANIVGVVVARVP